MKSKPEVMVFRGIIINTDNRKYQRRFQYFREKLDSICLIAGSDISNSPSANDVLLLQPSIKRFKVYGNCETVMVSNGTQSTLHKSNHISYLVLDISIVPQ